MHFLYPVLCVHLNRVYVLLCDPNKFQGPTSSLALVSFSSRYETPQSTPVRNPAFLLTHRLVFTLFGAQPSCWHIVQCQALIPFLIAQTFSSPSDVGPSNPPPSWPNVIADTPPRVHPSLGLSLLAGKLSRV